MDYYLNIPNKVDRVLGTLRGSGFDAYVVGGCVRDILLGKTPDDWDVTTSATPEEVKECFSDQKVVETGIKHGTVTVVIGGEGFEVTTFRSDGDYSDGRHPDNVRFSKDIKEDLARRDFAMNALAYSPSEGIVDEYGGIRDIKLGIIRCVGDPEERFAEDSLRVMRAIRFAATLGFTLDPDTAKAVKQQASSVDRASSERVRQELDKLILGDYAWIAIKKYRKELNEILAFSGTHISDRRSVKSLEHAPGSLRLRLALVLDTPDADGIQGFQNALRKLKYSNSISRPTTAIKRISARRIDREEKVIRLEMRKLADSFDAAEVPDILADGISVRCLKDRLKDDVTAHYFNMISGIVERDKCYSRSQLDVTGTELEKVGIAQGEKMGKVLSALLDEVIAGELTNDKDELLSRAKELYALL